MMPLDAVTERQNHSTAGISSKNNKKWNMQQSTYSCRDGTILQVPRPICRVAGSGQERIADRKLVRYQIDARRRAQISLNVSALQFDRGVTEITKCRRDIRTLILPNTIKRVEE